MLDRVQGQFGGADGFITYLYAGDAGETIVLTLETADDGDGVLQILDLDENVLAAADESIDTETLTYTFEEDALVLIRVRDFANRDVNFELAIDPE